MVVLMLIMRSEHVPVGLSTGSCEFDFVVLF